jgi:hypothetical protein
MNIIEKFLNTFGYGKVQDKVNKEEKPKSTAILNEDDDYMVGDYWTTRIKEVLRVDESDRSRYTELHLMDNEVPELAAALDVNADYIVYPNENDKSKTVKVTSTNAKAQAKIDEIEERVSVQNQLYPMIRSMLKYGDNAEELVTNVDCNKFLGFRNIPIKTMVPVMLDGFPNMEPRIVQVIAGKQHAKFNDNEVFHLCLRTDRERYCRYGKGVSMMEHSRLLYRQQRLMEEGVMITRLSRANQNYAIIVDVGELQGEDALAFLDAYKKRVTRRKYIDQRTGKWSWSYNPLSVIEDIMVPTRAGSGGNVVALNNNSSTGKNIEDIMYFQDKLIYSTGTPKILIGKEVDTNSKSTSDNQMIGFLRRIRRNQLIITPDIKKLYQNILRIEGVEVDLNELNVVWPLSMTVDEERKMATEKIRAEIAKILRVDIGCVDDRFIYTNILGMSESEADEMEDRVATMREDEDERNAALFAQPAVNGEDDSEDDSEKPTKEHLIGIVRNKLTDAQFKEWEKMQRIIHKNPELGDMVVDLITALQARTGN